MLSVFFYSIILLLWGSCFTAFWITDRERLVTLSLLQVLLALLFLAGLYIFAAGQKENLQIVQLILVGEILFAIIWLGLAFRLAGVSGESDRKHSYFQVVQCVLGGLCIILLFFAGVWRTALYVTDVGVAIYPFGPAYFHAIFLLAGTLFAAWQLEIFWRTLESTKRWAYQFIVAGGFVVCGALVWAASYRLTYGRLAVDHFYLLSGLLVVAWAFMGYATARFKLLNRKIFISRKIVYSFVAPTAFAVYLVVLGVVSLLVKTFGVDLPSVLYWMAIISGAIVVGLFLLSDRFRRRVMFFISTHFYVNKYEYRDEWLVLSALLKGTQTEAEVVNALQQVMAGSLYTTRIVIWTGDRAKGYRVLFSEPPLDAFSAKKISVDGIVVDSSKDGRLAPDDPLVLYLSTNSCLNLQEKKGDHSMGRDHHAVVAEKSGFLDEMGIVLMAPISIGEQLVGLIGLGPEFTGGKYGHDDYDLLIALGSQTAAALLAVRMAEELAMLRERQAWDRLSAFVLHDIKNAATMLSLVRANAPVHIHKPEFQEEMLEVVGDALARMEKVQHRLSMLKTDMSPVLTEMPLKDFLTDVCGRIGKRLPGMVIHVNCTPHITIRSDPELLGCILENLLLNAFEAGGDPPVVHIDVDWKDGQNWVSLAVADNGSGIDEALLSGALFEPYKTTREKGSGIGLWQARQLAERLKGTLHAEKAENGGARFVVCLPA